MKKVRSLYHKPLGERGFGRYIVAWTWCLGLFYNWKVLKYNYSHEELWFPAEDGNFTTTTQVCNQLSGLNSNGQDFYFSYKQTPIGQCFSSTTRGTANGVRFAAASEVVGKHPSRWRYIEYEVSDEKYEAAMPKLKAKVGNEYDFMEVSGFVVPFMPDNPKKDYCSGICDLAKFLFGIFKKTNKPISPRRSAMLLAKKFGEPKELC